MRRQKIIAVIQIVIALFMIGAIQTFLQPCKGNGDMVMKCVHSTNVVKLLLLTILIVGILGLISGKKTSSYFSFITLVLSVESILVPAFVIGDVR